MFLSDEGPAFEMLGFTIHIGSTVNDQPFYISICLCSEHCLCSTLVWHTCCDVLSSFFPSLLSETKKTQIMSISTDTVQTVKHHNNGWLDAG